MSGVMSNPRELYRCVEHNSTTDSRAHVTMFSKLYTVVLHTNVDMNFCIKQFVQA